MTITRLITSLSRERIQPYQDYIKTNFQNIQPSEISQKALRLYIWNIQLSSSLLEVISLYEVTLRNKIFNIIDKEQRYSIQNRGFQQELPPKVREKFDYVVNKIREDGKSVTNHLIVSRLSFSVWNAILIRHMKDRNSQNDTRNRNSHLYIHRARIFSSHVKNPDYWIKKLINVNSEINDIRNRICHHEHLLNKNITASYLKMLVIFKKLDYNIFLVVKENQRVTEILNNKVC